MNARFGSFLFLFILLLSSTPVYGQPKTNTPQWQVNFQTKSSEITENGKTTVTKGCHVDINKIGANTITEKFSGECDNVPDDICGDSSFIDFLNQQRKGIAIPYLSRSTGFSSLNSILNGINAQTQNLYSSICKNQGTLN